MDLTLKLEDTEQNIKVNIIGAAQHAQTLKH